MKTKELDLEERDETRKIPRVEYKANQCRLWETHCGCMVLFWHVHFDGPVLKETKHAQGHSCWLRSIILVDVEASWYSGQKFYAEEGKNIINTPKVPRFILKLKEDLITDEYYFLCLWYLGIFFNSSLKFHWRLQSDNSCLLGIQATWSTDKG